LEDTNCDLQSSGLNEAQTAALRLHRTRRRHASATHRVYTAGQRFELGAGWSQEAKSSGETYIGLKLGSPEFGPHWVRCRLVKLEQAAEDGATHMILWEPRDR
jgi:uncharacterized protein (DUF736 family)